MTAKRTAISFAGGPRPRIGAMTLEWPLEVDGARLDQIELRRLTGADMVALQDIATREGFDDADLFALVCDQPAPVLRALDEDDWLALKEKALDFLPAVSGRRPSPLRAPPQRDRRPRPVLRYRDPGSAGHGLARDRGLV